MPVVWERAGGSGDEQLPSERQAWAMTGKRPSAGGGSRTDGSGWVQSGPGQWNISTPPLQAAALLHHQGQAD